MAPLSVPAIGAGFERELLQKLLVQDAVAVRQRVVRTLLDGDAVVVAPASRYQLSNLQEAAKHVAVLRVHVELR